jgi:hypothetical protein
MISWLDEFGKYPTDRSRVKERDKAAANPSPRTLVDDAEAAFLAELERLLYVVAAVRSVMDARTALCEELPDRCLGTERGKKLDVRVADAEQYCLHPLLRHRLAMLDRHPEQLGVELDRRVQVLDGDADVVYLREHGTQFIY